MQTNRTMANIGRQSQVDPQNMHHFMSNSPWSGPGLIGAVQAKVKQRSEFQAGAMFHKQHSNGPNSRPARCCLWMKALTRKGATTALGRVDNTMGGWARWT
jgi:hypothetical protein